MTTNETADLFYDHGEYIKAVSAPEYRESARYRDEVAAKLQRSRAAGRISSMGEEISHAQRTHTRTAYADGENTNGYTMPGAHPHWAEAGKVTTGFFKRPEEIADARSAPAWDLDPTYQRAVQEKVARSIREGWLTADLQPADPMQRGG